MYSAFILFYLVSSIYFNISLLLMHWSLALGIFSCSK